MNKPIIIQGALQSELDYLLNNLTLTKKTYIGNFLFYECTYKNYPIIVSKTKMGEISSAIATTLAIQTYSPKFIINQGTAGAYAEWLNKGDIVLGEEFYYISQFSTDENKENEEINPWKQKEYRTIDNEIVSYNANQNLINWLKSLESLNSENVYFGTIGSGDVWTKDLKQIKKFYNDFNILCEAMECSGAYMSANSLNTPLVSIRVISNNEFKNQEYDETTGITSQILILNIIDEFIKNNI